MYIVHKPQPGHSVEVLARVRQPLLVGEGDALVLGSRENNLRYQVRKQTVLRLGRLDFLLPRRPKFRNVLVMNVHVGTKELQDAPPLVLRGDSPRVKPPVRAVEPPDPHRPRELLPGPDALAPGAEV